MSLLADCFTQSILSITILPHGNIDAIQFEKYFGMLSAIKIVDFRDLTPRTSHSGPFTILAGKGGRVLRIKYSRSFIKTLERYWDYHHYLRSPVVP
jgi:hypothetical protein